MHHIVPEFILENYQVGRFNGSFRAASMFLDISGFSAMTDNLMQHGQHGAEVLAQMMRTVFDPIVDAIFNQGGMIVGYAGDAVTALYPIELDDITVAGRVLASADTIQRGLQAKPSYETPYGTFQISAKIGIAVGQVSWGILRSRNGKKAIYYFRGEAVDEAARAEHQAHAGDIIFVKKIYDELGAELKADPLTPYYRLVWLSKKVPSLRYFEPPPIDPDIASVFVAEDVINQNLRGEFRMAVNLFMRFPDLTAEQLEAFMHAFFDLQARYGGFIDRIDFGDKGCSMIVLWGAPIAYENDIGRALNFTLDLKSVLEFPITAGLTYYISHAGFIGGRLYENYTCYGWGINLAARFMMSATEGEVWLDERAALRIKKRFNFDFVGKQLFKGFAQNQSVYVLRGRKAESELLFEGEMIGRDSELRKLTDFVAPVWSGKYAGVIGVWGEAGMGKSRLIHEFRHSSLFEEKRALWALCQSDQILRHSFNPIRYWLYRYFGVLPGEGEASRSQKFQRKLDTLISLTVDEELSVELNRTRSFLAALVDLNWPDSLYSQLDAQSRYDNTIIALISLIKAESLQQPLFLFLEDAHFLDEDSKAFLPRLKRALTVETIDYPIAILLTTRWQGIRVVLEEGLVDYDIDLSALSSAAISQLAAGILGNPADPALINLIDERAEGNPFFAEQILRYLQVEDNLELGSIGWTVRKNWKSTSLPADISTMLIARLDQLTNQVKEVVHAASILGREFEVQILSRMLANDVSLDDEIVEAEKASVWFPLNEIRYIFKHSLMRDVAYNMQLKTRRQELHAVALDALEGLYETELQHHYGELAYHSEQAALVEKAQGYLVLAGNLARDTYQNLQALDYYRRALGIAPIEALEHRYNLHRECEKVLTELGELDERTRELETLHSLADKMGEAGKQAEVEMLKSQIFVSRGQYDMSVELAKRATEEALHRNRYDVAINAYQILFDSYYQQGMYNEAIRYGELGLELSRSHGIPRDKAFILNRLGLAFLDLKDPSTATSYFEESLDMFRADDNLRGVARVLANLGVVVGHRGDFSAALGYFEQALDLAREIGTRRGEALLLGNLGWISGLLGNYRNALGYAERNLRAAREIGDKYLETYSLINLSSHAGALGDTEVAITYAEQGLELARQSNDRNAEAWALTYLGHGLLDSGTLSEAMKAYQAALILRNELDQSVLATEPEAGLARVALALGEQSEALTFVESIMAQLQRDSGLEGTDQLMRVYLSCYLVLRSVNDTRAPEVLNTAYRLLKKRADGIADPSARQLFLESITFNKELMSIWNEQNPG